MAATVSQFALDEAPRLLPARRFRPLPDGTIWRSVAPQTVRDAGEWGAGSQGWTAWCDHLARRSAPHPLVELLPAKSPLLWGVALQDDEGDAAHREGHTCGTAELIRHTDRLARKKPREFDGTLPAEMATWLERSDDGRGDNRGIGRALACLAWSRALPRLAAIVPAGLWWRLLTELLRAIDDSGDMAASGPHAQQLFGVELPLTLAYQLPEIEPCHELAAAALAAWEAGIMTLVDGDGFAAEQNLPLVRPLLACWTRVMSMAQHLDGATVSQPVRLRYRRFVEQALRLARRNGSMALTDQRPLPGDAALFTAAVGGLSEVDAQRAGSAERTAGKPNGGDAAAETNANQCVALRRIAESIFLDRFLPNKCLQYGGALPSPSAHSESCRLAILRPSWSRGGPRLWLAYDDAAVRIELASGRDRLLAGVWQSEIRLDGRPLSPRSRWEEVCWVSDEDADYVELEIELAYGVRQQRQILLAREDRLLLVADAVLGDESGGIEYRAVLPLADDVAFDAAGETREGYLVGRKPRAIVFPLALPEWRSQSGDGSLEATEAGLELRLSRPAARRLYAPLLFDLDPQRLFEPATWRTLTVAENRAVVPADVAVGYRAQIGKAQWLFYRSLAERGNRTLLGQNLSSEFLAARFTRRGETEPLLEIE